MLCQRSLVSLSCPVIRAEMQRLTCDGHEGIAYGVPDLDTVVRLIIHDAETSDQVGCVEARVYNGKTVYQSAVGWVLAVITGLGLVGSVVLSILGYSNVAPHVTFRTLLFLGYMQGQAMAGMTAVNQPPLVQSWTQNFQWTMGIVNAKFLQTICTWFQRATGGTPSNLVEMVQGSSVVLAKRTSQLSSLASRSTTTTSGGTEITLRGIERVGFRAGIPSTNIFMTGYLFFYFVAILMIICTMVLRLVLPPVAKKMNNEKLDRALSATADWKSFLRGCLYWLFAIGYPQMCVLCLWELTHHDSAAEVILAITLWLGMSGALGWATFKVFKRARTSQALNRTPAYALYSDPAYLAKWGFLYATYKAQRFYFSIALLAYIVIKGMIIAFSQSNPDAQSIVLLIFETAFMVATIVIRPYMDRAANGFAITAATLNFLTAVFIFIFSNVFGQPALMIGIMGVIFFFYNAFFVLALLIFLLIGLYYAVKLQEPAGPYQRLADRSSIHSSTHRVASELQPLEKIAQGDRSQYRFSGSSSDRTITPSRGEVDTRYRSPFADSSEPTLPFGGGGSDRSGRSGASRNGNGNDKFRPDRFHFA